MYVTYSFSSAEIGDPNLLPAVPCISDSNSLLLGFFNKALFRFGNIKHWCLISPISHASHRLRPYPSFHPYPLIFQSSRPPCLPHIFVLFREDWKLRPNNLKGQIREHFLLIYLCSLALVYGKLGLPLWHCLKSKYKYNYLSGSESM